MVSVTGPVFFCSPVYSAMSSGRSVVLSQQLAPPLLDRGQAGGEHERRLPDQLHGREADDRLARPARKHDDSAAAALGAGEEERLGRLPLVLAHHERRAGGRALPERDLPVPPRSRIRPDPRPGYPAATSACLSTPRCPGSTRKLVVSMRSARYWPGSPGPGAEARRSPRRGRCSADTSPSRVMTTRPKRAASSRISCSTLGGHRVPGVLPQRRHHLLGGQARGPGVPDGQRREAIGVDVLGALHELGERGERRPGLLGARRVDLQQDAAIALHDQSVVGRQRHAVRPRRLAALNCPADSLGGSSPVGSLPWPGGSRPRAGCA